HLVLDEADRMLDMGFYDDIMKIINYLPKSRQTLLFSATMPPKIRELTKKILKDPVQINIAISKPAEGILQAVYMVPDGMKNALICNLLKDKDDVKSIIIFSSTKIKVKNIERDLRHLGRKVQAIHSDLDQKDREDVMREFRNRKYQILVATDIISRGIDIENIDLVVNYDVPPDAEDYIHRIGRTARAENTGVAITLVNDKDRRNLQKIEKFLGQPIYKIPLPADL
ncbi:MAG: helicase-related protein, partial [Bacteroidota bacterium]|nr:helicase-related protein [Bacteroidota bacterium]